MDKLTGQVKDKMLKDHRDRHEESKEKPDPQFQKAGAGYAGSRMEDIKEQDSEAEIGNSNIF